MSYFYCPNVEAGRQLRPIQHSTQGSPSGKLIHAPKAQIIIAGVANVVSPSPSSSVLGGVNTLIPGVSGTERAFILYISALNRVLAGVIELTVVRTGVDDVFNFVFGGDTDLTAVEKADYYLALYMTHSTTSISFRQSEGDGSVGNTYRWKAIYGPAEFRPESLNV